MINNKSSILMQTLVNSKKKIKVKKEFTVYAIQKAKQSIFKLMLLDLMFFLIELIRYLDIVTFLNAKDSSISGPDNLKLCNFRQLK